MDQFHQSGRDRRSGPHNDEHSLVGLYCRGGKLAALPTPACKPLHTASAITTRECASTTSTTEPKAAWPLFMGGDLPSFPVKVKQQRTATVSATTSSYPHADDSSSHSAFGYEASVSSYSYSGRSSSCSSPSSLSYGSSSLDELEESFLNHAKLPTLHHQSSSPASSSSSTLCSSSWSEDRGSSPQHRSGNYKSACATSRSPAHVLMNGKSPLLEIGADVMANIFTFLEPTEILRVLTMPLSKEWKQTVSSQQELWRVLCLVAPFKANVQSTGQSDSDDDDSDDDDDSFCSVLDSENDVNDIYGKYRIMYTSFVRCVKYLARIKEDAENGRPPSAIAYDKVGGGFPHAFGVSKSLKKFLAKSRGVVESPTLALMGEEATGASQPIGVADDGTSSLSDSTENSKKRSATDNMPPDAKKPKLAARSMITDRLLGPSSKGAPGPTNLPKSCAIYSIVNWMVAYADVEGIQAMCIKSLPSLLEDEEQRKTAQRAGITDVVLRAMVLFPDCLELHVAAFHTMVLLARPLGGREGQLFDNSMGDSSPIGLLGVSGAPASLAARPGLAAACRGETQGNANGGEMNGIAIMLDSMRRFESEDKLQAMACWAMVNIALAPAQKSMLICMGGIQAATNAMSRHPHNSDVQFRALFALINLVIPSRAKSSTRLSSSNSRTEQSAEKEILDGLVGGIASLVVSAMKVFCSNETILNRACLVLHNLSQCQDYISALLWTPHCYQMLEWCIGNYPTDQVLRRSAVSTLHRLQVALSGDPSLRARFTESIRREQEASSRRSAEAAASGSSGQFHQPQMPQRQQLRFAQM